MNRIKLAEDPDNESILLCPDCGCSLLHHGKVEVFDCGEDEEEGNHVIVDGDDITVNRSLLGNPSPRRQGLKINFRCEKCNDVKVFVLRQHKGNTFLSWISQEEEQNWIKSQQEEIESLYK